MLDFSTGELIVIGIAAYVFLGPKQVPTVTYYLGKGLGRAVGFINRGRDLIGETVQSQQLQQFYNSDITKGFKTFQKIQSELMSAQINPIETVRYAMMNKTLQDEKHEASVNAAHGKQEEPGGIGKTVGTDRLVFTNAASELSLPEATPAQLVDQPVTYPEHFTLANAKVNPVAEYRGGSDMFIEVIKERQLLVQLEQGQQEPTHSSASAASSIDQVSK